MMRRSICTARRKNYAPIMLAKEWTLAICARRLIATRTAFAVMWWLHRPRRYVIAGRAVYLTQ